MTKAFTRIRQGAARAWNAVKSTFTLTSYGGFSSVFSRLTASWGDQSHDALTELAARNAVARRAITFIAQNLASIPLQLVRETDGDLEEVNDHPILSLLENPAGPDNHRYGYRWMIDTMVWALHGSGEFWLRGISPQGGSNAGQPRRLRIYDASDFSAFIRDTRTNFVTGYTLMDYNHRTVDLDTEEALHAYLANPTDRDRGLPILLSVKRSLELVEQMEEWNMAIAGSKGQVPGFMRPVGLDPSQQLSREQVQQAQDQMDERIASARDDNKWSVLNGAFEPVERQINPKDTDWLDGIRHFERKIATGIGIDPTLLGDEAAKTYNNYSTALVIAYTTTILPMMDFILDHLNEWLVPKFGDENLKLTYDRGQIDALDEQLLQRVEALVQAIEGGLLTPDEARGEMNREAVDADELLFPMNKVTQGMLFGGGAQDMPADMRAIASLTPEQAKKEIDRVLDDIDVVPSGDGR